MQQDSLYHATVPAETVEEIPAEQSAGEELPRHSHKPQALPADTVAPDPRLMKPLPPGEPLTMKPKLLADDYWANGLLRVDKAPLVRQLDSITGRTTQSLAIEVQGVAGDPVPYRFRSDDYVTLALLLGFFFVVWVVSRSRHFLREQVKAFFFTSRRENLFAPRGGTELNGRLFLVLQTSFILGILFFDYTQVCQTEVFNQVSPYRILIASTLVCGVFYALKTMLYAFVNAVFFDRDQRVQWNHAYLLCVFALGVSLFPLALLVVYFDLGYRSMTAAFLCLLAVDKLLLLYKCRVIFFKGTLGWLHLILYFCTLEIMPLAILLRALIYTNNLLLTFN